MLRANSLGHGLIIIYPRHQAVRQMKPSQSDFRFLENAARSNSAERTPISVQGSPSTSPAAEPRRRLFIIFIRTSKLFFMGWFRLRRRAPLHGESPGREDYGDLTADELRGQRR